MPPHSSTAGASGSRPWIRSHTSDPMTPTLGTRGRLIQEGLRGAVHAGRARQLARDDPAGLDRRLERAPRHFPAQRHEEVVAGEGDAAADDDDFGIEDVEQVARCRRRGTWRCRARPRARARRRPGAASYTVCAVISGRSPLTYWRQPALGAGLDGLDGPHRDGGARRVRLEAAVVAALAAAALGVDGDMADLPRARPTRRGRAGRPRSMPPPMPVPMVMPIALRVPRAAPTHHSPSIAQLASLSSAAGRPSRVVDRSPQRHVDPAEVGGEQHDAALGVERARRPDPDAQDLRPRHLAAGCARCARSARRRAGRRTSFGAGLGVGRLAVEPRAGCCRPRSRCPRPRLVPPMSIPRTNRTRRPPRSATAAYRLQHRLDRELPHAPVMTQRAHRRSVAEQGRHGSAGLLDDASPGPAGRIRMPEPSGRRSPPRACPTAVARWSGAESLVTSTPRAASTAADVAQAEAAGGAVSALRRRGHDRVGQRGVLRPAEHHHRPVERRGQRRVPRPALRSPDRSGGERHEPRSDAPRAQPFVGRGVIAGAEREPHRRGRRRAGAREGQEPLDLVAGRPAAERGGCRWPRPGRRRSRSARPRRSGARAPPSATTGAAARPARSRAPGAARPAATDPRAPARRRACRTG